MPRTCTICQHPHRAEIDAALVSGTPYRSIAKQFEASPQAVLRHKSEHLPARLAQAHEAGEVAQADNLLGQVRGLQAKALRILLKAEAQGDLRTALAAIREARGNLELLAKLLGELDERPQVNILLADPEWLAVFAAIRRALLAYPGALDAVDHAVAHLEAAS